MNSSFSLQESGLVSLASKKSLLIQKAASQTWKQNFTVWRCSMTLGRTARPAEEQTEAKSNPDRLSWVFWKERAHWQPLDLAAEWISLTSMEESKHFSRLHELFQATRGLLSIVFWQDYPCPRICLPVDQVLGVQERGQNFGFKPSDELWGNVIEEQAEWKSINVDSVGLG